MLLFNEKLVYPLCMVLFILSLYLIPHWDLESFDCVPETESFLYIIWLALPVLVFSFKHSPAISSFAVDQKKHYGQEEAAFYVSRTLRYSSSILVLCVMFFVFSCGLGLCPEELAKARAQKLNVLSYLANELDEPLIAVTGHFIALLAISTSFFGHDLGVHEGLNGLIVKLSGRHAPRKTKLRSIFMTLFCFFSLWYMAAANPVF